MKRNVKMKLVISLVVIVLLVALIVGFFMSRRGDGEVRSAYDYNKTATVSKAPSKQSTSKASDQNASAKYEKVLTQYQNALQKKSNQDTCKKEKLSTLLPKLYEGIPLKNVGYWIGDYNGDGTTDLIIGVTEDYNHFPYAILAYYTLDSDQKVVNVFRSTPSDYYTAISKKRIMEKVSDQDLTAWYLYHLNVKGTDVTFREGILRDKSSNEAWYQAEDTNGDFSSSPKLSKSVGKDQQKSYDDSRLQLSYTAFNDYHPTKS